MTNSLGQDLWDIYEDLKEGNRIGFLTDDEFQKYFLGFISYKYLSEKLEAFVNNKLKYENLNFEEAYKHDDYKKSLREDSIKEIGYFLKPDLLFKNILYSNNIGNLNEELEKAFNEISDSSIGTKSEEDFQNLFEGVDLNASQLGKEKKEKNKVIFNILEALGSVHFDLGKEGMDNRIFRKTILENSKFDEIDNEMSLLDNKVGRWSRKRQNEYHKLNAKHNIQKDFADLDRLVDAKMEKEVMVEADYAIADKEEILSYKNEKNNEKEIDNLIGSGFEYLLSKFSLNSSNSADFYTPNEVSTLIADLIASQKRHLDSVYDPCCGSASLLLEIHKTIPCDAIYGQEINASFYNIARENMILHNIHYDDFDIKQGDTLEQPQHLGESFEAVVSQIPFNSKWSADKSFRKDIRFSEYKFLAPRTKADYAFIQHMLYHLRDDDGIMLVVAPHGVLFRGSTEGRIRKLIVEKKNYLDAVIGLPANMFYSTNNPACLLIFRKNRGEDEDILFIDASRDFKKSKLINRLTQEDIENIVVTYKNREEIDKYSHRASLEDIKRNDFNLNIPRYVDAYEDKEEKIDPKELSYEHEKILAEIDVLNREIEMVSKDLNIKDIFYK